MGLRLYLIGGLVLAVLAAIALYGNDKFRAGADSVEAKNMKQTIKDIRERNSDDVETQNLSDFAICVRDFGRVPECDNFK